MEFKIEKGIPVPPKKGSNYNDVIGTLNKMKVGDSFLCNMDTANAFRSVAPRKRMRVTGRKQQDGQYRVWRIE